MSEITAELPADGRPMEGRSVADSTPIRPRSHSRLGRLKLKTVADLDGRTRAARRARAVVAELVKALGGPDAVSPGQRQACERAGMLTAIAEDLAARQLARLPVTLDPARTVYEGGHRSGSTPGGASPFAALCGRTSNLYPMPCTERMNRGAFGSGSILRRRRATSISTLRS